jgi:hypothetical protein
VPSGTDLADMINIVVTNRTGVNPGVEATSRFLGAARIFGLDAGTAPWSEILNVLDSFGLVAWYDRVGHIQVGAQVPDPTTAYPLDLLTSLSANYDTRPPNVIVARGEAQDGTPPVQAISMDDDPSSPTYAGTGPGTSPYGRCTFFFSSPLLLDEGQAQITAGDTVSITGTAYAVDAVTLDINGDTSMAAREVS